MASATGMQEQLKQDAIRGLKWNYGGQIVRNLCSLAVGIVLARLLGPQPFGQVAIALLIIGIGNQMADLGFGAALVQRKELGAREIRFAFSVQVLLGAGLSLLCILLAGSLGEVFRQPGVASVIRALGPLFLLQSLGQSAASLLKRRLAFRALQAAQIFSYLAGYAAVGLPLALAGFGVWALVWAQLVQAGVNSAAVYACARHPVAPVFRGERQMISFGGKVIATNLVNWVITNLDTALAGRWFAAAELGLYNRSFALAGTPLSSGLAALQGVLFPVCSRGAERTAALARMYRVALAMVALAVFPVYAAIAAAPGAVITALYGSKWSAAAPLLAAFALAMPFHAAMGIAGPLLWGTGKVDYELRAQAAVALAAALLFFAAGRASLTTLAWSVALIYGLRFVLVTRGLLQLLHVSWTQLLQTLRGPLCLAALAAASVSMLEGMLSSRGTSAVLRLMLEMTLAAALPCGALWLFPVQVAGRDADVLLDCIRACFPRPLRRLLPHTALRQA